MKNELYQNEKIEMNSCIIIFKNWFRFLKFSSIFLLMNLSSTAQDMYPVGSKWYYSQYSIWSADINFVTLEVIADTTIGGINCKKLNKLSGCDFLPQATFIYSDSNRVYFYNNYLQAFTLLYDFNADSGSNWTVYPEYTALDSIIIFVDSTSTTIINNDTLKVLYTSNGNNSTWNFQGMFTEKIGGFTYFFPQYNICDVNSGPLRCYSDSAFGLYETGMADSCDEVILTGINSIANENDLLVYPNPMTDVLKIKFKNSIFNQNCSLTVYDVLGRNILVEKMIAANGFSVNAKNFPNGFYYGVIIQNNKRFIFNFVKN